MNSNSCHHRNLPASACTGVAVALVGVFLLLFSAAATLSAQTGANGSLRGRVYNSGTGNYLEGATVTLVETGRVQLTDRLGQYFFAEVPAGAATVRVSYPGLPVATATTTVSGGVRTVMEDVGLGGEDLELVKLADFVVQGEREGQAKAIVMERDAPNVVSVVATDAYGNVGSNSVGNLMQYLPGLTTSGFDGEAFEVSVRGMDPGYGSVTMDGARVASSAIGGAGLSRSTYVLDIGLVNFSEIEVIKAPTPDKAADSIGGVINLRTRSVFATKAMSSGRLSVGMGTTLKEGMRFKQPHPSFTLNYRRILGSEKKFGFTFNASSNTRYLPRDQKNIEYESTYDTIDPETPYVDGVAQQYGHQEIIRRSVGGRLEFKPNETSLFSLGVTYNYQYRFNMQQSVNWRSQGSDIGTAVLPADYASGTPYTGAIDIQSGYTADEVFWPKAQVSYGSQIHTTNTDQLALRFAGEHGLGDWKIDYDANYSHYNKKQRRSGDWPGGIGGNASLTLRNVGLRVTGLGDAPNLFDVEHVGGRAPDAVASYQTFRFDDNNQNWSETSLSSGTFNVSRTLHWAAPTVLKAGLDYRQQEQNALPTSYGRYTHIGSKSALTPERIGKSSPFVADYPRNPLGARMPMFFDGIIDASSIRADVQRNPQDWSEPVQRPQGDVDRGFTEGITSAYLMATSRLFEERLTLLGGVRVERTDIEARDNLAANPFTDEEMIVQKRNYTDAFPSLHATWRHPSGLQLRVSYSTSVGRPNPNSIVPSTTVRDLDPDDEGIGLPGRIDVVNTGLKPRYADNYDVELEYYFKRGGRASIGVFRKDLSSFIEQDTFILGPGNEYGDEYIGWEVRTQKNGGKGRVEGVEAEYQSPSLGGIATFLKYISVFANYTYLKAVGQFADGSSGDLVGFKPETANAGFSYNRSGTSIRMRTNFVGEWYRFADSDLVDQRWEYDQTKVDINFEQKLGKNLSLYVDVINVFNAKGRRFRGTPETGRRIHWVDNNGPEIYAGINMIF